MICKLLKSDHEKVLLVMQKKLLPFLVAFAIADWDICLSLMNLRISSLITAGSCLNNSSSSSLISACICCCSLSLSSVIPFAGLVAIQAAPPSEPRLKKPFKKSNVIKKFENIFFTENLSSIWLNLKII